MLLLLINTNTPTAELALARDAKVLAHRAWENTPQLGQQLLTEITSLLATQHLKLTDLDRIAVHSGPGHYSALRQGVMTATMLAYALDIEVVGVTGEGTDSLIAAARTTTPQPTIQPIYPHSARLS